MTKDNKEKIKQAYTEVLSVCEKYADKSYLSNYNFEDVRNIRDKAKNHLMLIDWYEKYGLDIEHSKQIHGYNYVKIDDSRCFSYFKDAKAEKETGSGRYISWEDDEKQPKNEWLFCLGFSTGAYIFGEDYPTELFQELWQELKSYKPKYCDSQNKNMYFSLKTAKKIYNEYPKILEKYYKKNKTDAKKRKIKKMEEELKELKNK